jgi:PAS domain S-box-containing protein
MPFDQEFIWKRLCEGEALQQSSSANLSREDLEETLYRAKTKLEAYHALYNNTPSAYFVLNLKAIVLGINDYGATRLGYTATELVDQPVFNTFHEDDRTALEAAFSNFVRSPSTPDIAKDDHSLDLDDQVLTSGWEFRQVCKDGTVIWVRITLRILRHSDIAAVVLFVCEDVTQRKQAEAQLHLLEQAIVGSNSGIVVVNATQPDQPLTYVNPCFERMTGYSAAEVIGRNCRLLQGSDTNQPGLTELRSALQEGSACQVVVRNYRKDGSLFWNELHISPLYSLTGQLTHFVGVQSDVTERQRSEAALRQQAEQEQRVLALTRLSAGIAQRIRRSLDLEEILQTTVAEVRQFLNADRVFIYQFEPDWSGIIVVESVGEAWLPIQGIRIRDTFFDSAAGRDLYKQGRVQAIADVHQAGLSSCHLDLMNRLQVRASLVVPILQQVAIDQVVGEQLWGLLVAHQCVGDRHWQQLEIDLLCQLASQVGIAIQQAELYQQVRRLNTKLEQQVQERTAQLQQALDCEALLKRITDKVRDTLDESQILQTVVRELSLGLDISSCETALYNIAQSQIAPCTTEFSRGVATIRYEHTGLGFPVAADRVLPMSESPEIYTQLLAGQYFQFCRLRLRQGWRAVLACPIFDDEGTLGDLWLFKSKEHLFNDSEIRLVQQVATQCAIALRQAQLYQTLQTQLEELENFNQLKDDFLNTIAHELRSPVCNMKMAIQMLEVANCREALSASEAEMVDQQRSSRYLKILQNECDREISLINDLLTLQKLEAKIQSVSRGAIELSVWLVQLLKPFQEQVYQRQQVLELHLSPNLPILISDSVHLERILGELLNNACKYTPPGERIILTAQAEARTVRLTVCSSGIELSKEEQSRIFEKFYQISPTHRQGSDRRQSGLGLGLLLVKRLTDLLGGRVWVESKASQTCFMIELPIDS